MQSPCGEEEEAGGAGGQRWDRKGGNTGTLAVLLLLVMQRTAVGGIRAGRDVIWLELQRVPLAVRGRRGGWKARQVTTACVLVSYDWALASTHRAGGDSGGKDGRGSACSLSHQELEAS